MKLRIAYLVLAISVLLSPQVFGAEAAEQKASESKTEDKLENLNKTLANLKMVKDSIVFFAKRLKANNDLDDSKVAEAGLLYEQTRSAFNAWVDTILNDLSARHSLQDTSGYSALAAEANKRAARFLAFAEKYDSVRLTSSGESTPLIALLNNLTLNFDVNKAMDQFGAALTGMGAALMNSVTYLQIRWDIEKVRMEPFKELGKPEETASGKEATKTEISALLHAKMLMAAGHTASGVNEFESGFISVVNRAAKTGNLRGFDESYVQDYMMTLKQLSDKARIDKASAKLEFLLEKR